MKINILYLIKNFKLILFFILLIFITSNHAYSQASNKSFIFEKASTVLIHQNEKRNIEFLYKLPKLTYINQITLESLHTLPIEHRPKKIQILVSEFDTEDETYWLSCGIFSIDINLKTVTLEFDVIEAQFIKIRILELDSKSFPSDLGKIIIKSATFDLIGNVVNLNTNEPIESAEVFINNEKKSISDANGKFLISNLPFSTFEVTINALGYEKFNKKMSCFSNDSIEVLFQLQRHLHTIFGNVIDFNTKKPIALANVIIKQCFETNEVIIKEVITDEFGNYYGGNLQDGTYKIIVNAENYNELSKLITINANQSYAINFILKTKNTEQLKAIDIIPKHNENFTDEIKLIFNIDISNIHFNLDNVFVTQIKTTNNQITTIPLSIKEILLDKHDVTNKTLILKIDFENEKYDKMPEIEININTENEQNEILISNRKEE